MPQFNAPELVIFDCDGVIVDSETLAGKVFWGHLNALGWSICLEETNKLFIGRSLKDCFTLAETELNKRLPANFETRLQQSTFAAFETSLKPMPGIQNMVEFLNNQKIPYCVASSGSHEKMSTTLRITGLSLLFPQRFSSSEVRHGKPAPDLFLHACKMMGQTPNKCWVIEDSPTGVSAAIRAGMRPIKLGGEQMSGVTHVGSHFELARLFNKSN